MPTSLHELIEAQLGVNVQVRLSTFAAGVTSQRALDNNPNRVALTITNLGANEVYLLPDFGVSATAGIRLNQNGGSVSLQWEYDLDVIAYNWYVITSVGTSIIQMIEAVTI